MKQTFEIQVPARKRYDPVAHEYKVVRDAKKAQIVLEIDIQQIAQKLGAKAVDARTRKATGLNGLVKASYVPDWKR